MLAVQWGGGGGGGSDSSDSGSNIQSYSDEEGGSFCAESAPATSPQSAAITAVVSSDEDFTDPAVVAAVTSGGMKIVRHAHRHRPVHKKGKVRSGKVRVERGEGGGGQRGLVGGNKREVGKPEL